MPIEKAYLVHVDLLPRFLDYTPRANQGVHPAKKLIVIQCKDVGSYYTLLELAFSMGTLLWKVSQILSIFLISGYLNPLHNQDKSQTVFQIQILKMKRRSTNTC